MGRASTDEMAELTLRVVTRNQADRRTLSEAFGRRLQARTMIRLANLRFSEGRARFTEGDHRAAIRLFQEVLRYRPDNVEALVWLSRTFLSVGDAESATFVARRAVSVSERSDPEALDALAAALAAAGGSPLN